VDEPVAVRFEVESLGTEEQEVLQRVQEFVGVAELWVEKWAEQGLIAKLTVKEA